MTREGVAAYAVGRRVALVGDHPWAGSSGKIVGSVTPGLARLGLAWEVELDDGDYPGHQVAARENDILPVQSNG